MLALLSPAKTLDFKSAPPEVEPGRPRLAAEAEVLAMAAAGLGAERLGALMHISDKLAHLNAGRFASFTDQPERPALFAFAGDVYTGFEARTLEEPGLAFAQDHVRILSGLYGLLRPLDLIRPHRLEMGTRWAPGGAGRLTDWWGERIARLLGQDMAEAETNVLVNLASQEYWAAIAPFPPEGARIITIDFREEGPNGLRFSSFAAKRARGMMARYLCEHRLDDVDALKGFDTDGYRWRAAESEGDRWLFARGQE